MYHGLMSSKELARRNLGEITSRVETLLDAIDDPVDRLAVCDELRADLAVILTRSARKSAWEAKTTGRFAALTDSQWRGRKYLLKMAKQYADDQSLPNFMVRDIVTRQALDLTDLARLRGRTR